MAWGSNGLRNASRHFRVYYRHCSAACKSTKWNVSRSDLHKICGQSVSNGLVSKLRSQSPSGGSAIEPIYLRKLKHVVILKQKIKHLSFTEPIFYFEKTNTNLDGHFSKNWNLTRKPRVIPHLLYRLVCLVHGLICTACWCWCGSERLSAERTHACLPAFLLQPASGRDSAAPGQRESRLVLPPTQELLHLLYGRSAHFLLPWCILFCGFFFVCVCVLWGQAEEDLKSLNCLKLD